MFNTFAKFITVQLLNLDPESSFGISVHFFIYDVVKIMFLIFAVMTVIGFIRTYLSPEKLRSFMAKSRWGMGHLAASLFGALTPFCNCSSIPLFLGFIKARVPLGIAFSYLITAPLVNEMAFIIMGGFFGWKLAIIYAATGIALGVIIGIILGKLGLEKHLILEENKGKIHEKAMPKKLSARLHYALRETKVTLKKLWPYVLGGVAVGAGIHGYVPQEFFTNTIGQYELLSVPMAVLVGVPIYAGCSTVVPVIFSITANGVPLGTSLAFMMSIAGLSLPEAIILKRVMSMKLLALYFGVVTVGIIVIGLLFNILM
jgi:uncharacterized protein